MRDDIEVQISHHIHLLRRALVTVETQLDLLVTALAIEDAQEDCDYGAEAPGENYSGLTEKK